MTDPRSLIDFLGPRDQLLAPPNGGTKAPSVCGHLSIKTSSGMEMMCLQGPNKNTDVIGTGRQGVSFTEYQDFKGKKVARLLIRGPQYFG